MRRVALIVNPKAGRGLSLDQRLNKMTQILTASNFATEVAKTSSLPGSARELAANAAERCDLVIACGGDGTVHEVLQGVAQTQTCLGVLPFGTANALARNLGLPLDPVAALKTLLGYVPTTIPLGLAETSKGTRWFTVMAGAGPDGRLVHEMKLSAKSRMGRVAYYAEAARIFATRHFPPFRIDYRLHGSTAWESREAIAMMASRIPDLGGLFRGLTPGSRLHHPHLLVQLLAAPARIALPAWIAMGRAGMSQRNRWLTTIEAEEVRCSPLDGAAITYAQVDAEAVGAIPISLRVVDKAITMLMPSQVAQTI